MDRAQGKRRLAGHQVTPPPRSGSRMGVMLASELEANPAGLKPGIDGVCVAAEGRQFKQRLDDGEPRVICDGG